MKTIAMVVMLVFTITTLQAQNKDILNGKWEAYYELEDQKGYVTYEFKTVEGKLEAYSVSMRDENNYQLDDNTLTLKNVRFKDGEGKCKYLIEYEGKTYDVSAKLKLKDANTLEVSYSYYGYSDTEIWKRQ